MITFARDFFIYYLALSTMMGLVIGLTKLFDIGIGLRSDFYFSCLGFEHIIIFCDWHYFISLISANDALGLIFAVICEYLDVCVPLLRPEFVALVRLAEL